MPKDGVRPWFHLLVERAPIGPIPLGVGIGIVVAALVAGLHRLLPAGASMLEVEPVWIAIVSLVVPYAIVVNALVIRESARDFEQLRPLRTWSSDAFDQLAGRVTHAPLAGLVAATLVGVGVSGLQGLRHVAANPSAGAVEGGVYALSGGLAWMVVWPVFYVTYRAIRAFHVAGRDALRVSLLNPDSLRPFSTFGLRTALGLLASAPIYFVPIALASFDRGAWVRNLLLFSPAALLAFAALVLPAVGVHRRIREEKQAELARANAALAGDRAALAGSPLAGSAGELSIVELLVYRDRIAGLSEWPFQADALRRFGLYLLIPIGSWIGGALVERLVDRVMTGSGP